MPDNSALWAAQVIRTVPKACGCPSGWNLVELRDGTYSLQCPECAGVLQGFVWAPAAELPASMRPPGMRALEERARRLRVGG